MKQIHRLDRGLNSSILRYMVLFVGCCFLLNATGCANDQNTRVDEEQKPVSYADLMNQWKSKATNDVVTCWYTKGEDQVFLETAAKEFEQKYGISVSLVYYDGMKLFEDINLASQEGKGPDVYLIGNDQLELAKNSGMACENDAFDEVLWKQTYPLVAKDAVTLHGKQYGYPIYFDTYCLVYDASLLETAPASVDDILTFADAYEDTGATKAIFRWDVADSYVNSMFYGNYIDLFGEMGDDGQSLLLNGDKAKEAMTYFQSLTEYLWMNKSNISHETVKNRIKDKTLVLGLCKTDILPILYALRDEKTEEVTEDYKVALVPSLTQELSSCTYSTTYLGVVNPFGNDVNLGNMFALYLSMEDGDKQYALNQHLSVIDQQEQFDEFQQVIYSQYINSTPVPKVMLLGDYLSESAIAFDEIWAGSDVVEQLDQLQERMNNKMK